MGNCLKRIDQSDDVVWAGEDWTSLDYGNNDKPQRYGNVAMERLRLLSDHHEQTRSLGSEDHDHRGSGRGREVKIRISKRELEQLVGVKGLSTEQLMARLIINGHDRSESDHLPHLEHQRSWRPVLQSIPEVD